MEGDFFLGEAREDAEDAMEVSAMDVFGFFLLAAFLKGKSY